MTQRERRLFYTRGDYGLWQCSKACRNRTYDNEQAVRQMIAKQRDMKIPSELVPCMPVQIKGKRFSPTV